VLGAVSQVILPLVLMAGVGFLLQRTVGIDVRALSKLNVNVLVPFFLFDNFYRTGISLSDAGTTALYTWLVMAAMLAAALAFSRLRRMSRPLAVAFAVSTIFYNSGNYGLSVMELVFSGEARETATSIQAVVLTTQNVTTFTLGAFVIASGKRSVSESVRHILRYPILPAFMLALLLRYVGAELPSFVAIASHRIATALVPMGLLTLGAQIGTVRRVDQPAALGASAAIRLVGGPLAGLGIIHMLGISGLAAQVLLIGSAVPTAVNTALLSIEFESESDFASQAVLCSTLASVATATCVIAFALSRW